MEPPSSKSQLVRSLSLSEIFIDIHKFYLWGGAFCYWPGHVPLSHRSRKCRVPFRPLGRSSPGWLIGEGGNAWPTEAGVVLGAQSQLPERPGFVVGVLAAVLMSSVAKHIACLLLNSGKRWTFSKPPIFQKFCLGCGRPDVIIWLYEGQQELWGTACKVLSFCPCTTTPTSRLSRCAKMYVFLRFQWCFPLKLGSQWKARCWEGNAKWLPFVSGAWGSTWLAIVLGNQWKFSKWWEWIRCNASNFDMQTNALLWMSQGSKNPCSCWSLCVKRMGLAHLVLRN